MTKKEARARKAAWQAAIAEGRAVKFDQGLTFRSYPTAKQAQEIVAATVAAGYPAEIVKDQSQ